MCALTACTRGEINNRCAFVRNAVDEASGLVTVDEYSAAASREKRGWLMSFKKFEIEAISEVSEALKGVRLAKAKREFREIWQDEQTRKRFAHNLAFCKRSHGFTNARLAKAAGVHHSHLDRFLYSKAGVSFSVALTLSNILGESLAKMLTEIFAKDAKPGIRTSSRPD